MTGIEASSEIQAAARKVIEENRRLRLLLAQHGLNPEDISDEDSCQQQSNAAWASNTTPRSNNAQALESLLSVRKWSCCESQGSPPEAGCASTMPCESNINGLVGSPPPAQVAWISTPESTQEPGTEQLESSVQSLNTPQSSWVPSTDNFQCQPQQQLCGESGPCTPGSSYSFNNQCCTTKCCTPQVGEQQAVLQHQSKVQPVGLPGPCNIGGTTTAQGDQRAAFNYASQAPHVSNNQYNYLQQLQSLYDPSIPAFQPNQHRTIQVPIPPGPPYQTPGYVVGGPSCTSEPQAVGTNSCTYATDMITTIAGDIHPSDVRTDLGCSPQCGTDCEVSNQVVFDVMDRYSSMRR